MAKIHDLDEIKKKAINYVASQNYPVTLRTIAKKIGEQLKVVNYVFSINRDTFKGHYRGIKTNRPVYTL